MIYSIAYRIMKDERGRMWLMYELAGLYELQGRPHDAFSLYEEIVQRKGIVPA